MRDLNTFQSLQPLFSPLFSQSSWILFILFLLRYRLSGVFFFFFFFPHYTSFNPNDKICAVFAFQSNPYDLIWSWTTQCCFLSAPACQFHISFIWSAITSTQGSENQSFFTEVIKRLLSWLKGATVDYWSWRRCKQQTLMSDVAHYSVPTTSSLRGFMAA